MLLEGKVYPAVGLAAQQFETTLIIVTGKRYLVNEE